MVEMQSGGNPPGKSAGISDLVSTMIPCHHGFHWVGVVRRVINGKTYLYYSDDFRPDGQGCGLRNAAEPNRNKGLSWHPQQTFPVVYPSSSLQK